MNDVILAACITVTPFLDQNWTSEKAWADEVVSKYSAIMAAIRRDRAPADAARDLADAADDIGATACASHLREYADDIEKGEE